MLPFWNNTESKHNNNSPHYLKAAFIYFHVKKGEELRLVMKSEENHVIKTKCHANEKKIPRKTFFATVRIKLYIIYINLNFYPFYFILKLLLLLLFKI